LPDLLQKNFHPKPFRKTGVDRFSGRLALTGDTARNAESAAFSKRGGLLFYFCHWYACLLHGKSDVGTFRR
jgi:hypothetical protein